MISRRAAVGVIGSAALWPLIVRAQSADRVRKIGYLRNSPADLDPNREAFVEALRALGYVDGRNVVLEFRYTEDRDELLERYAAELAALPVDVIVANGTPAAQAAARATRTIPIVVPAIGDPVAAHVAESLAKPGGNVTGISVMSTDLARKRMELLHEVLPGVTRVGMLANPDNASGPPQIKEAAAAAQLLGLTFRAYAVRPRDGFDAVFAAIVRDGTEALVIADDAALLSHRATIIGLATTHRLPTLAGFTAFIDAGTLLIYGSDTSAGRYRKAAYFVDRILKGAKPADLPFEQTTKFTFVVNLKTAKALGVTIPPSILARADQVIE